MSKLKIFYSVLSWLIFVSVGVVAVGLIYNLINYESPDEFTKRVPGTDRAEGFVPEDSIDPRSDIKVIKFSEKPSPTPGEWPQFRGPNRDAVSPQSVKLARKWPETGPKVLWEIEVGQGYAGAVVNKGSVYFLDYDRENQRDTARCLSLEKGEDVWQFSYPVKVKRNHGMSRTVSAVSDEYLVSLGPKCHVTCVDAGSGEFKWMIDLVKEYGTTEPPWYAGQCPLIEDGRAIIAPGGSSLMIAVDCNSGEVLWNTPNPNGWKMTHSSIIPIEFKGRRIYLYCASGGIVGVCAEDGNILFEINEWKIRIANVPTPVVVSESEIFLCGGYNAGSAMMELIQEDGRIIPKIKYRLEAGVFGSAQQTPIFYKGNIYGVRPDEQLVCLDIKGKVLWSSSVNHKFGLGAYVIADGLIYVVDDDGVLSMVEARNDKFNLLGQAKVLPGPDAWGPMAIVDGRLIIRDLNKMICLDVRETAD